MFPIWGETDLISGWGQEAPRHQNGGNGSKWLPDPTPPIYWFFFTTSAAETRLYSLQYMSTNITNAVFRTT